MIEHNDICMNCPDQHKRYMHNQEGCQAMGCRCPLTGEEEKTKFPWSD